MRASAGTPARWTAALALTTYVAGLAALGARLVARRDVAGSPQRDTKENAMKRHRTALAGVVAAAALATAACPGNITHSYRGFTSALERGASCAELFDQRQRFSGAEDLAKIDADLARIGCVSRESVRTDR